MFVVLFNKYENEIIDKNSLQGVNVQTITLEERNFVTFNCYESQLANNNKSDFVFLFQ